MRRALALAAVVLGSLFATPGADARARVEMPSSSFSSVTVYGATWCGACKALERALHDRNIPFDEVDVDRNPEAYARARAATGTNAIPLTSVAKGSDVTWIVGADADAVERAYKQLAPRRTEPRRLRIASCTRARVARGVRARRRLISMATMIGSEKQLGTLLNHLIELDYDAIEAYRAAIDRLQDATAKSQLGSFLEDHRRHVIDLTPLVQELGMTPAVGPDVKRVLTKGKVVIAGLMGDHAVLLAMKTNEDDTNKAYERAIARTDLSDRIRMVLQRNLSDERRHREWIEQRIAAEKQIPARSH